MATFVLVHGSWHGAWCWRRFAPLLQAAGHAVHAPTLAGCAERHRPGDTGIMLDTHIEEVANLLFFEDLTDVILVGHSYAGMVVQGAVNRAPERIRASIYLDAYVVPPGSRGFDLWTAERLAEARRLIAAGDPFRAPFSPDLLGITDPAMAEWVRARLTPHPLATYDRVIEAETAAAARLPRVYLQCTAGPLAPVFAPIVRTVRDWGWAVQAHSWPHDAMLTDPDALATACIEYAAGLPDPAPR